MDDVVTILHYVIKSIKSRDFKDEDGKKIKNKFGYLKKSILENIDKFKNNEIEWDEELGWFKEIEEVKNDFIYDYDDYNVISLGNYIRKYVVFIKQLFLYSRF